MGGDELDGPSEQRFSNVVARASPNHISGVLMLFGRNETNHSDLDNRFHLLQVKKEQQWGRLAQSWPDDDVSLPKALSLWPTLLTTCCSWLDRTSDGISYFHTAWKCGCNGIHVLDWVRSWDGLRRNTWGGNTCWLAQWVSHKHPSFGINTWSECLTGGYIWQLSDPDWVRL